MHVLLRDVHVAQDGIGRDAVTDQHVEDGTKLGRLIDPVAGADGQDLIGGACRLLETRGWLQRESAFPSTPDNRGGNVAGEPASLQRQIPVRQRRAT
ncbi:hypothetical protein UP10_29920 [Bradyrhizobium sp. LTSPM299]|nr:hypothetical protein UP10_29920 [Bradyrhizobium sp. LTSPM299]